MLNLIMRSALMHLIMGKAIDECSKKMPVPIGVCNLMIMVFSIRMTIFTGILNASEAFIFSLTLMLGSG
jgi:hypothetical protein